jgi:peptide/nickel transport system substrate-binding protein
VKARRAGFSLAALVCGLALLAASVAQSHASVAARNGGTFKVSVSAAFVDTPDPALSYTITGWAILDATCAGLMTYPDKPPPAGLRIEPEVAASYPRVSRDAKTFTFTLRPGFRFSDGAPIRADAFARAIGRGLAPGVESAAAEYMKDIVGAADVTAGKRTLPAGVHAQGTRLVIKFTRPIPDFPARTTMPFFCAVPPSLPADPEGRVVFAGSGRYAVSDYVRGRRITLVRNRFYSGKRSPIDRFEFDLQAATPGDTLDKIERGEADWGWAPPPFYLDPARGLIRKYGINRGRFFLTPGYTLSAFLLNSRRPLFRNNPSLRRAVNFAVDRKALLRGRSATATDQLLPPGIPGFIDARIYPLAGPDTRKAQALASGHRRKGKAVLYSIDLPAEQARAQILVRNLKAIGIDVEVKRFQPKAFFGQLDNPRAAFDIAAFDWFPDYIDPFQYTNAIFDKRLHGGLSLARFDSPLYNRLLRRTAALGGDARYRAYGELDVRMSREAAPSVPIGYGREATFVSSRVGCVVLKPYLVLTAVCLK